MPIHTSENPEAVAEGNAMFPDIVDQRHSKHDSVVDANKFTTAKKLIVCCDGSPLALLDLQAQADVL